MGTVRRITQAGVHDPRVNLYEFDPPLRWVRLRGHSGPIETAGYSRFALVCIVADVGTGIAWAIFPSDENGKGLDSALQDENGLQVEVNDMQYLEVLVRDSFEVILYSLGYEEQDEEHSDLRQEGIGMIQNAVAGMNAATRGLMLEDEERSEQ